MWSFRKDVICPKDKKSLSRYKQYKDYYRVKYDIACELKPRRILEIGVRAGYSAWAFLSACPDAKYLGIDAENNKHGGAGGPWLWWAEQLLRDFDIELRKQDTQKLTKIDGSFDLIHIDGDHSTKGALHDMEICWPSVNKDGVMLVDDYDYLEDVQKAVDAFYKKHPEVSREYRKSLRGEILFRRDG